MPMDAYLKIADIPGECKQKGFEGWIMLDSWSWGSSSAGASDRGGGLVGGKVQMQDFSFQKLTDKSTPKLFESCCKATVHSPIKLRMVRMPENQIVLDFAFEHCVISSFQTSGGAGDGGVPMETGSINFSKVKWTQSAFKEDGVKEGDVHASYDMARMEE
jgi:type VI secretion system secreted protein Hcp